MSMYLSNLDIGPTGVEPGEFIDGPLLARADPARSEPPAPSSEGEDGDAAHR